jgi:NarL family two-component system response regulator LiaR
MAVVGRAGVSGQPEGAVARIRVVVVDDQAMVRGGIIALLATEPDLEVVGEAADGDAAVDLVGAVRPDVVLMDLVMPGTGGVEAITRIVERDPGVRIVVLTSFATDERVFPAIKAGALGYLLKDSDPEELPRAVRQAHRGEPSLHPEIARKLLREIKAPGEPPVPQPQPDDHLTAREVEVLQLVAGGLSNHAIAQRLVVGDTTVRSHVSSILGKLQLASRTQAALYALREGYSSLDDVRLPG